jgi:hypothetical protein
LSSSNRRNLAVRQLRSGSKTIIASPETLYLRIIPKGRKLNEQEHNKFANPPISSRVRNICNQRGPSQRAAAHSTGNARTCSGYYTGHGAAITFTFSDAIAESEEHNRGPH